jgi:hydrogenase nickel incorporation protein HypA/HybF
MHEMSIAESLIEIVEGAARGNGLRRVTVVRMRVGEMSGVVPSALEFCFDAVTRGTFAEGARLEIATVPVRGACTECRHGFDVRDNRFACPACGSPLVAVSGGQELSVDELEGE